MVTMLQFNPILSSDHPASAPAARARPRPSGGLQADRGPQAQAPGTHQDEDKGQRRGAGEIFFILPDIFRGKSRSHSYFIALQVRPCQVCGEVAGRHSYYGGEVWQYDTVMMTKKNII